jgi:hypothetical protein
MRSSVLDRLPGGILDRRSAGSRRCFLGGGTGERSGPSIADA